MYDDINAHWFHQYIYTPRAYTHIGWLFVGDILRHDNLLFLFYHTSILHHRFEATTFTVLYQCCTYQQKSKIRMGQMAKWMNVWRRLKYIKTMRSYRHHHFNAYICLLEFCFHLKFCDFILLFFEFSSWNQVMPHVVSIIVMETNWPTYFYHYICFSRRHFELNYMFI